MASYSEAADHFDKNHIPTDRRSQQEIRQYMNENFRDKTVPDSLAEEVADRVADKRAERAEKSTASGGDFYYDEDAGGWRDPDSGRFL